jgi:hypothetical protein
MRPRTHIPKEGPFTQADHKAFIARLREQVVRESYAAKRLHDEAMARTDMRQFLTARGLAA